MGSICYSWDDTPFAWMETPFTWKEACVIQKITNAAGGIGILHTSAADTIQQLQKLGL